MRAGKCEELPFLWCVRRQQDAFRAPSSELLAAKEKKTRKFIRTQFTLQHY